MLYTSYDYEHYQPYIDESIGISRPALLDRFLCSDRIPWHTVPSYTLQLSLSGGRFWRRRLTNWHRGAVGRLHVVHRVIFMQSGMCSGFLVILASCGELICTLCASAKFVRIRIWSLNTPNRVRSAQFYCINVCGCTGCGAFSLLDNCCYSYLVTGALDESGTLVRNFVRYAGIVPIL